MNGAREVQKKVLSEIESEDLKIFVVWAPVLETDTREKAVEAMKLVPDKRVVHFWDPEKKLGYRYGKVVELPEKKDLAWDVYFVFGAKCKWGDEPPKPADWMHQLAKDERRLDGDKLRKAVEKQLTDLKR